MGAPKVRLAVAACLFLAWIGWLAYLVSSTRDPVILSRPQLLVSNLWVIAEVKETAGRPAPLVTVRKVAWPEAKDSNLAQTQIHVADLPSVGREQGWAGPGEYILPLVEQKAGKTRIYQVTRLPPSPGYQSNFRTVQLVSVGPKKKEVAELMSKISGDLADAKKRLEKIPTDVKVNVSEDEAGEIEKSFKAQGALTRSYQAETRIYRATPQAIEQLDQLRGQRN